MAKFRKAFLGVPAGEIYPREFARGDECPPELLDAAIALGSVKAPKASAEVEKADEDDDEDDDDAPVVIVEGGGPVAPVAPGASGWSEPVPAPVFEGEPAAQAEA